MTSQWRGFLGLRDKKIYISQPAEDLSAPH